MKHDGSNQQAQSQTAAATQAKPATAPSGGVSDRAALRGMNYAEGAKAVAPPPGAGRLVPSLAKQGVSGAGGPLPFAEQIQQSFGKHDVSGARGHVGGGAGAAAEQMGARAYAHGDDVAFAGNPDLHTAAHEAAHVVQQRAGLMPAGGVGSEGDAYEQHADAVADKVVTGQSAEGELDKMAGPAGGGAATQAKAVQFDKIGGKPIRKLDAATIDQMIAALRPTAAWQELVELWRMVTDGGANKIAAADRDDIVLEVLILVESAFSFEGEASVDQLWGDAALLGRFLGAIEQQAKPAAEDDGPAEPEPPQVVLPNPGTHGILTAAAELVEAGGATIRVDEGETVKALRGDDGKLVVEVLSRPKGKVGSVDPGLFKAQPKLGKEDDGSAHDYSYKKYEGDLFLAKGGVAKPSVMDIDQGALGDCYLISAMGAVAASNPDIIADMISVDAASGSFAVTFQQLQRDGSFKPVVIEVDGYMPTRHGTSRMAYALSDTSFDPNKQALWPAVIEKAYAQWKGGYDAIGDGGVSAKAMEEMTGVRSVQAAMPRPDQVLDRFAGFQREKSAVVCGTRDEIDQRSIEGLFQPAGDGFRGKLVDKEGNGAEVKKNTVSIRDKEGKGGTVRDDGKGGIAGSGLQSGSVAYDGGSTELVYKEDRAPGAAEDLVATYQFEGTLSAALNVHSNHAYVFREVKDGLLYFQNPWGPAASKHPKGLTPEQFRDLFETIGVNATIPQQER
ncbi:MAG: DUF4157 domain-containing protein [Deltaproteobacteria bacterium]|nr:DUF4157 domain-containing protein [Deltaproteobacteria bacterium]